jgi:hypothetical protein
MRFSDFYSHARKVLNHCLLLNSIGPFSKSYDQYDIHIFKKPSSIEVSDAPEKLQFQLIELQHGSVVCNNFSQEVSVTIFSSSQVGLAVL